MFDDDDAFEDVGTVQQIPKRGIRFVEVGGRDVMLSRFDSEILAMGGNCTHAFASLRDAEISGTTIKCRRHGAQFDLRTGHSLSGTCPNLPRFEIKLAGVRVLVRCDND